jgi:hypothetical protein
MSLPQYTGRKYFSASLSNEYTRSLLTSYAWAVSPRPIFSGLRSAQTGNNIWTGYILYTGDTDSFRYRLNHTVAGTTTIKVNGSGIASVNGSGVKAGAATTAGLGLTPGEVYSVVLDTDATCDPQWLGYSHTISYTSPPSFSNGNVLTAAQMNTLRTCLGQLESARDMPWSPNVLARRGAPGHSNGYETDTAVVNFRGFVWHTHDTLRYRIRHGTEQKKVISKIYVDGNDITGTDLREGTFDNTVAGTYDISGLGLSRGSVYEIYTTVDRSGTSNSLRVFQWLFQLSEEAAADATPPPVWAHGGTNVSATNMNRYGTIIDDIHPAAAAPTKPLYWEQPAVRTDPTGYRYYVQHRRKWLRYRVRSDVGGKTTELYYGPNLNLRYALPSDAGNQSFDLSSLKIGLGQYFYIEDCEFCTEYSTSQA